jgi:hypothetical protein
MDLQSIGDLKACFAEYVVVKRRIANPSKLG